VGGGIFPRAPHFPPNRGAPQARETAVGEFSNHISASERQKA